MLYVNVCAVPHKSQFTVKGRSTIIGSSSKVINTRRLFENKGSLKSSRLLNINIVMGWWL